MATVVIRNFEEARYLLRQGRVAVPASSHGFGQAMQALFAPVGGFAFSRIQDEAPREPPDFAE